MPFGQQSGPPASSKQIAYLQSLLSAAGYEDFRSARHPFGLTQRQAAGKFTAGEVAALIDQLTGAESSEVADEAPPAPRTSRAPSRSSGDPLDDTRRDVLRGMPAELLSDELVRRGWATLPPPDVDR